MEAVVLADIVPFLPSVLKKIPWQLRTGLYAAVVAYAAYILLAWIFGWPTSTEALRIFGVVAGVAGLPALGNVTVGGKATKEAVVTDVEAIAAAVVAKLPELHLHVDAGAVAAAAAAVGVPSPSLPAPQVPAVDPSASGGMITSPPVA